MTSVTIAGGSFDAPRRMRRAKGFSLSPRHQTWLRYGVGVSIAGLLSANGFALMSMLGEAARELTGGADRAAASAQAAPAASAVDASGAGFAAFDIPLDLDAHYRALAARTAPTMAPAANPGGPTTAAFVPAELGTIPAAQPDMATAPAPSPTRTTDPGNGGNADVNVPHATDPSVIDQVVATVATVPGAGTTVAPVAADVAAGAEEVVVDPVVEAVTEPAPAPVRDGVTETVSALL